MSISKISVAGWVSECLSDRSHDHSRDPPSPRNPVRTPPRNAVTNAGVGGAVHSPPAVASPPKPPTRLFRIVHIDNLASLVEAGGIVAPNRPTPTSTEYVAIHNVTVQDRRARCAVPCGPGGVVHDYVAFYFTSRSPMLYANYKGTTGDNADGQEPILCLVAHAEPLAASGARYVFTDGHAIMRLSNFYDDLSELDSLPWDVIEAKYWDDYPDGRRLRQAEFLVHDFVPWEQIQGIAVINETMRQRVDEILDTWEPLAHRPPVRVVRRWYC